MSVAIFGTGYVFWKYKNEIPCDICCLIDNAPEKQGDEIAGIKIIAPNEIFYYEYSFIVIMTFAFEEIEHQLLEMGISREKILNYSQISFLQGTYPRICTAGEMKPFEEWLAGCEGKKTILVVSHDFSYTGAPVALMNLVMVLKSMDYAVIMAGLTDGKLVRELEKNEIDYVKELNVCFGTEWFGLMAQRFDYIVVGTLVLHKFVHRCSSLSVKILWWIHESDRSMYDGVDLSWLTDNIKMFGAGKRVSDFFALCYKEAKIGKLFYCIPETEHALQRLDKSDDKVTFAVIGTISYRKAQDIVVDAVKKVPSQYKESFRCLMIGAFSDVEQKYCNKIQEEIINVKQIDMLGELDQDQISQLYHNIDVLLCPSRDDPMPIVVTQAMMHRKTCIISENVGQSEYIQHGENGLLFINGKPEELANQMIWAIEHKELLCRIGERSRKIYDDRFSMSVMKKNIGNIFLEWEESTHNSDISDGRSALRNE